MDSSKAKIYINGSFSHSFPVMAVVRQGDALSATLLYLALHSVIKKMNINEDTSYAC